MISEQSQEKLAKKLTVTERLDNLASGFEKHVVCHMITKEIPHVEELEFDVDSALYQTIMYRIQIALEAAATVPDISRPVQCLIRDMKTVNAWKY